MRRAMLLFVVVPWWFGLPGDAQAGCWDVIYRDGTRVRADDVWHIRNVHTGLSALLGSFDGKDSSLLLREVRAVRWRAPAHRGWFRRAEVAAEIERNDGRRLAFVSELPLTVQVGDKKSEVALDRLASLVRCAAAAPGAPPADAAGPGVPAGQGVFRLHDGTRLVGTLETAEIRWRTPYGRLTVTARHLKSLRLEKDRQGVLETWSGDRIAGRLETRRLAVRLHIGGRLELDAAALATASFSRAATGR